MSKFVSQSRYGQVPSYRYKPLKLDCIWHCLRVLDLRPASRLDAVLQCSFRHVMIRIMVFPKPCDYEALSYVWGPSEPVNYVQVLDNQQALLGTLPVARNLDQALRHLRQPLRTRSLWVDALCINQSDEKEKKEQIRAMAHIFLRANRTIIWLGLGDPDVQVGLKWVARIGRATAKRWRVARLYRNYVERAMLRSGLFLLTRNKTKRVH
jgi:hypothetical protein